MVKVATENHYNVHRSTLFSDYTIQRNVTGLENVLEDRATFPDDR